MKLLSTSLALAALCAPPVAAHEHRAGSLAITHPWTKQTAPGQSVGGGFMTIANNGANADQLTGGSTPFAERVEIHTMSMDGGVMRMRPLREGLAIPAHGSVALAPGGYHIMLVGLKKPLALGSQVPLTLRFRRAGNVAVTLAVESVAYQGPEAHHAGH